MSDLGATAQALVERFPLQLRVAWPSYGSADFNELFAAVSKNGNGENMAIEFEEVLRLQRATKMVIVPESVSRILAELIANAVATGATVSPRTAVHALDIIRASAVINSRNEATREDIVAVKYLPGLEEIAGKIAAEIDAAYKRAQAQAQLDEHGKTLSQLQSEVGTETSPIKLLQISRRAEALRDALGTLTVPDPLVPRRNEMRAAAEKVMNTATENARKNTRI